ncbi:MAG: glycosyltransferase [bacterium]|nr:glycosyltransferase [Candidatus Kapabacteria bacterium]
MIYLALAVSFAIVVWSALSIWITLRRRRAHPIPHSPSTFPSVSIVVAALDEESMIEQAIRCMLALDYPELEIVAINDRSRDRTGAILDAIAAEHPSRVRVLHIEELPDGWLGKCHALEQGASVAKGEWLLFTDADVLFDPQSLRIAMAHRHARDVDHIVFAPQLMWHGYIEAALLTLFGMSLSIAFRSWAIESRSLRAFVGFGGFNLVRRSLYEQFGTHRALRLEVADDMKLGLLVKKFGGRSTLIDSEGMVRVRWRAGARDVMRGLERSGFAGIDFRWSAIAAATFFFAVVMLAPYALLFAGGMIAFVAAIALAVLTIAYGVVAHAGRAPVWIGILHPIVCLMYTWALIRSAVITTRRGGLSWRGTFYSIDELKGGTVRR